VFNFVAHIGSIGRGLEEEDLLWLAYYSEALYLYFVMGVPKFFRWISERYPCLSEVVREYQVLNYLIMKLESVELV